MSKFTRDQLKGLVKECLVEILSEGLAPPSVRSTQAGDMSHMIEERQSSRIASGPRRAALPPRSQSPALNSTVYNSTPTKRSAPSPQPMRPAIMESVGQITSDPIMSQILADTAMTTLQEQIGAESSRPGSPSMEESVGSPADLFEGAQNWATLAFSDTGGRGQNLKS